MSRLMLEHGQMKHMMLCSRSQFDAEKRLMLVKPKGSAFGINVFAKLVCIVLVDICSLYMFV